jgi:hypothetical protein
MSKFAQSFQDMEVYRESFLLQQEIFKMSKQLPADERFSLTDQIRRSSRSIGANIAESWLRPVEENLCSMFMRSRARGMAGFTSAKPIVWNAGWNNTMQAEFYLPETTGLG